MSTSITDPAVSAPPAPPKPPGKSKAVSAEASDGGAATGAKWKGSRSLASLTPFQVGLAVVILLLWLHLFAGGMLIDTQPYRCALGWTAIEKINPKTINDHPCNAFWVENGERTARVFNNRYGVPALSGVGGAVTAADATAAATQPAAAAQQPAPALPVRPVPFNELALPWLLTILFFTPLNLAFVAAAAGALGSLGSIANLNDDSDTSASATRDRTNPLVSGLLRGMFVYLFVISGMLLFDDSPFSATSPDQYVRLAGFLSLFSFVVNYQPKIFSTLIDWANTRIQSRNGAGSIVQGRQGEVVKATAPPGGEARLVNRTVSVTEAVVESADEEDAAGRPQLAEADDSSRNGRSNGGGPAGFGG
ncbi:MAG TPA: hypothetical protein VK421_08105 [Pyrinomonadaceae bacterium]|nr:hypothetical protein [Pyrinomonadaceae bacterium]